MFDHLGSAGLVTIEEKYRNTKKQKIHKYTNIKQLCLITSEVQGLSPLYTFAEPGVRASQKNCHSWCCTDVHFKTHIPVIAYCLGKYWERGKEYCIHSALENILSFQKLCLVLCRKNVQCDCDLDFVIKLMSNTLHREYA